MLISRVRAALRGRTARIVALAAALVFVAPFGWTSLSALARVGHGTAISDPADFRAFYCAARTLGERRDPYQTEPLRSCEQAAARAYRLQLFQGLVLPAPLPPYALALLMPLGRLDFRVASPLWLGLSLVAFAVATVLLGRLAKLPVALVALALAGPVAFVSLPLGQPMPLVVASLCASALAMRTGRYSLAASLCALTTIEPHIGLPACLAAFVICGRTRRAFLVCAAFAVLGSFCFSSTNLAVEYVSRVIPLHALSQVDAFAVQYSLTAALRAAGVPTMQALLAGSISYGLLTLLGVYVARQLMRRYGDAAFVVLVPPAFAVIGGTFVHLAQIAVAVPALLLLGAYVPRGSRAHGCVLAAAFALAIPWSSVADAPPFAAAIWRHPVAPRAVDLRALTETTLADITEADFIHGGGYGSNGGPAQVVAALKLPTWFGLLCFATLATRRAVYTATSAVRRAI
jgi:hypothetical protein